MGSAHLISRITEMKSTSEKILDKIKTQQLQPQPRWKFLAKNWFFWLLFGVSLTIGSITISMILDIVVGHDWDIYPYLHKTFLEYVFFSLPYLWIVLMALFSLVTWYNFTHTKGWYRHRTYLVIIATVALSVILGAFGFYFGLGSKIDDVMANNLPYYQMINTAEKRAIWNHPDEGLLGGKIEQIENSDEFIVKDETGKQWDVQVPDPQSQVKTAEIVKGEKIKIIGKKVDDKTFNAKEIRDWDPHEAKERPKKVDDDDDETCNVGNDCDGDADED